MYKLILLSAACALIACSDGKSSSTGRADGGADKTDDAGTASLERAPGSLARPPGKKLPDDLKPPGYAQ